MRVSTRRAANVGRKEARGRAVRSSSFVLCCCALFLAVCCSPLAVFAQVHGAPGDTTPVKKGVPGALEKVGIDQHLNEQLPLDAIFRDELGNDVPLGTYFKERPVALVFVYYECPMLCNQVLNGVLGTAKTLSLEVGKDYDIVAISFDPRENEKPGLAGEKKQSFVDRYNRPGSSSGWHFLTGTEENIRRATDSVGFRYAWDEQTQQFAHASAVMIATPEGRLARYIYGIEYPPKDLKLGLIEASDRKIGSPVDALLLYCYHYDPAAGSYRSKIAITAMRIGGVTILTGLALLYGGLYLYQRKRRLSGAAAA